MLLRLRSSYDVQKIELIWYVAVILWEMLYMRTPALVSASL